MWRIRRNVRSMKEYHLNTKIIEMYKFQQLLLRIIPQTLQFSRKLKEAMSQDYFNENTLSLAFLAFFSHSARKVTAKTQFLPPFLTRLLTSLPGSLFFPERKETLGTRLPSFLSITLKCPHYLIDWRIPVSYEVMKANSVLPASSVIYRRSYPTLAME